MRIKVLVIVASIIAVSFATPLSDSLAQQGVAWRGGRRLGGGDPLQQDV